MTTAGQRHDPTTSAAAASRRDAAQGFVYRFREFPGEAVRIELGPEKLTVRNSKRGDRSLAYVDIKTIRLFSTLPGVYVCAIYPQVGRRVLVANRSNAGGTLPNPEFRYQNDAYIAFVEKLHTATAPCKNISYRAGMRVVFVLLAVAGVLLTVAILALLGAVVWALAKGKGDALSAVGPQLAGLAGLMMSAPVIFNILCRGPGRPYVPTDLPRDQLPGPS